MIQARGLENVVAVETAISEVDGEKGRLIYRGHPAQEIALTRSFEEAAHFLLYGTFPDEKERRSFAEALQKNRTVPEHVKRIIDQLPPEFGMMGVLRTAVSALDDPSWPPETEQALRLIALLPSIIAYRHRRLQHLAEILPDPALDHVSNYLYMLNGTPPSAAQVKALTTYMILAAEHGLNASTFAARVTLSTQSDLFSAISAAIGCMKGPLHGGAPSEVIAMLDAIGEAQHAEPWIRNRLEAGERIMGFGHRVYKTVDPRAEALKETARRLQGEDPWMALALHVEKTAVRLLEEYKPGRRLYTNVEFYAAAVLKTLRMSADLFTPTFTAARIVGWTAHVLEQAKHNRLFRPQAKYVGPHTEQ